MSLRRRGGGGEALNPWPGYVDALSTLLMVIIFVLLVFVLAQAFLGVALSGKDRALDRLNRQMAELTDMLSLERGHGAELQAAVAGLARDLATATGARDQLTRQVGALQRNWPPPRPSVTPCRPSGPAWRPSSPMRRRRRSPPQARNERCSASWPTPPAARTPPGRRRPAPPANWRRRDASLPPPRPSWTAPWRRTRRR